MYYKQYSDQYYLLKYQLFPHSQVILTIILSKHLILIYHAK